jgi:hypothetical protein
MAAITGVNYFWIGGSSKGITSKSYDVFITNRTYTQGTRQNETTTSPYRNGTIIELSDYYSNSTITYDCICWNYDKKRGSAYWADPTTQIMFQNFVKALNTAIANYSEDGYFRLRDTYEDPYLPDSSKIPKGLEYHDAFCFAYLESISNIEYIGKDEAVTFTLTFSCKPKWYYSDQYDSWDKYESETGTIEFYAVPATGPDYSCGITSFPAFKFYGSSYVYITHTYTDANGNTVDEDCGQFMIADLPDTTSGNYYLFDLETLELTFVSSDQTTSYNQALTMLSTARPRIPNGGGATTKIKVTRTDGKSQSKMIRIALRGFRL